MIYIDLRYFGYFFRYDTMDFMLAAMIFFCILVICGIFVIRPRYPRRRNLPESFIAPTTRPWDSEFSSENFTDLLSSICYSSFYAFFS